MIASAQMQMKGARVTIMAGGTGGHVFPAMAVAERLTELGCSVSWVGTARGIENRVVPEAGYELNLIPISGLRGKGIKSLLLAPFKLCGALISSLKLLAQLKPHLVLGFGGFVAGPVGLAARLRGDALAIHEQNARAGTTNIVLARWADRVMTGFPNVFEKADYVGNPIRSNMRAKPNLHNSAEDAAPKLNILVLGGSQGARSLNRMVPSALSALGEKHSLNIRHQCGSKWLDETQQAYSQSAIEVDVIPFIDDMSQAYQWADLVVCRAGAMTVAEITFMGLPALFIPFPYAIDDHQTANAQWLCDLGGAELMQETEITEASLIEKIDSLISEGRLTNIANIAASAAKPQATEHIVDICKELMNVH